MTPNEPSMRKGINLHMTILRNVKYDFELAAFNENYKNISMKIAANALDIFLNPAYIERFIQIQVINLSKNLFSSNEL